MNILVLIVVIGIITFLYFFQFVLSIIDGGKNHSLYSFAQLLLFIIMIFLTIVILTRLQNVETQLKNKCPELEKVEDVYRIKE